MTLVRIDAYKDIKTDRSSSVKLIVREIAVKQKDLVQLQLVAKQIYVVVD